MSRDEVPEAWPPADAAGRGPVVPMFPLPGAFLFPGQILTLHVFEPRYRQMVEDVLDGPGRLVVATIRETQEGADAPAVLPIAGLGEIARHEKTEDGRYFLWLFGLGRVWLDEVSSERLYRKVRLAPVQEIPPPPAAARDLEKPLGAAIRARSPGLGELREGIPTASLADKLTEILPLSQAEMEPIFAEYDVERRARMALEAHERCPPSEQE